MRSGGEPSTWLRSVLFLEFPTKNSIPRLLRQNEPSNWLSVPILRRTVQMLRFNRMMVAVAALVAVSATGCEKKAEAPAGEQAAGEAPKAEEP